MGEKAKALCCVNVTLLRNGLRTLKPTLLINRGESGEQAEEDIPYGDAPPKRGNSANRVLSTIIRG